MANHKQARLLLVFNSCDHSRLGWHALPPQVCCCKRRCASTRASTPPERAVFATPSMFYSLTGQHGRATETEKRPSRLGSSNGGREFQYS
jgi:hypothetical protein